MEPSFLLDLWLGKPAWMWFAFIGVVLGLLALDLGVLHRESRVIGVRESLLTSSFYLALGAGFGAWVWWSLGADSGMAYLTVFAFFAIPPGLQHRVLFWGILGVIVLRAIMIAAGAAVVADFSWVLYVFAAILIATGVKMLVIADRPHDVAGNPVLRFVRNRFRITEGLEGERFFVRRTEPATGRAVWYATPLFLALAMVEFADLIFAIDSIPAIFAITTDPFVVYTSNIFAILGLRALYFALAAMVHRFRYLKAALAAVLIFIGSKIFVADLLGWTKFPPALSLGITFGLIAAGVAWSLVRTRGAAAPGSASVS